MNIRNTWRFTSMGLIFAAIGMVIIGRVVLIHIGPEREDIGEFEKEDGVQEEVLKPARGDIYDRDGNLLAGSELIYDVAINLHDIKNPRTIAMAASGYLGLDYSQVYQQASQDPETVEATDTYITLDYYVTEEEVSELEALRESLENDPKIDEASGAEKRNHSLNGLIITPRLARSYPEKGLASNVLGLVNLTDESIYGVEAYLDQLLAGLIKRKISLGTHSKF